MGTSSSGAGPSSSPAWFSAGSASTSGSSSELCSCSWSYLSPRLAKMLSMGKKQGARLSPFVASAEREIAATIVALTDTRSGQVGTRRKWPH